MSVLVTIRAISVPVTAPCTQQLFIKCLLSKLTINVEVIPLKSSLLLFRCRVMLQTLTCWAWEGTLLGNNNNS